MIYVNARAIIERVVDGRTQVVVQWRNKRGEGCYEFPGGRIEPFESFYDALVREVKEECGLDVVAIEGQDDSIHSVGGWTMEGFRPYAVYQTLQGAVCSMGVHFVCTAEGELLSEGDDSMNARWIELDELREIVETAGKFSNIDRIAAMRYLKE